MRALLRAAFLLTLGAAASAGEPEGIEFGLTFLPIHGRRVDTLTYDFDGDGKGDLLNTSIDADADPPARWLALHLQRGGATRSPPTSSGP